MRKIIMISALLLGFAVNAAAQNWVDYLNGTFHRPTLAVDEYGNLQPLLLMYEDARVEASIPDFTGTYDSITKPALFKRTGDYMFILYVYHKDNHKTSRTLIAGNAQSGEIHVHTMDDLGGLFGPVIDYHGNKGLPLPVEKTVLAYMKLMVYLHESEGKDK